MLKHWKNTSACRLTQMRMPRSRIGLQKTPLWCASDSVINPKTVLCTIFVHVVTKSFDTWILSIFLGYVVTLKPLDFKFSEMTDTVPVSVFNWSMCYLEHQNGVIAFLLIFGHLVTLNFDLWTSDFSKYWTLPKLVLPLTKIAPWYIWMELLLQSWICTHIWSCSDLDL